VRVVDGRLPAQLRAERPDPGDSASNIPPTKPFWEEYPTLGSAQLSLTLFVQLFAVRNNHRERIEFRSDAIPITGSPRDPQLSGPDFRVTHGEFPPSPATARPRFHPPPAARSTSRRTSRRVTPRLHVTSDADYRDLFGPRTT